MSNILYARQNPVFEYTNTIPGAGTVSGGCILDLRLHWPSSIGSPVAPEGIDIEHGKSIVTSVAYSKGESLSISFAARHPLKDMYYTVDITCSSQEGTAYVRYLVAEGVYLAHNKVYYVSTAGSEQQSIRSEIKWPGGYILVNLNADLSEQPEVGSIVEPFNVVFEPIAEGGTDPVIGGIPMAGKLSIEGGVPIELGTIFTNSPIVNQKAAVPYYNLEVVRETLQFTRNAVSTTTNGISVKSINGVVPENGNINIQVLG